MTAPSAIDRLRAFDPDVNAITFTDVTRAILELSDKVEDAIHSGLMRHAQSRFGTAIPERPSSLTYRVVEPDATKSRDERFAVAHARVMRDYAHTFQLLALEERIERAIKLLKTIIEMSSIGYPLERSKMQSVIDVLSGDAPTGAR